MLEWERDRDADERLSFDDSDRFEEDSLCSWCSEPESLCNNWRGWKKQTGTNSAPSYPTSSLRRNEDGSLLSLTELCARVVAAHTPFELVEHSWQPVPEPLQLRIAFWSFPDNEEDIRLYSCLANGSPDEFQKGEQLYRLRAVKEPLQIGFHLSAAVIPPLTLSQNKTTVYNVAVTFDRRHITSCNCTCTSRGATMASWCSHIVAVCLHRIHQASSVCLRAPVSESLSRLQRDQLQKFAQYLISELPQQILPTAQRLLDELLSTQPSAINTLRGAPDPTAGASASEQTSWCLDESTLHENIRKILIKFCVPSPTVFSDVNYLSTTAPPAAAEWSSLLRPLRGREPEGMWNLLSIVREMFKRHDRNAVPMLEVITEECMACEQIMVWWFNTKVALHSGSNPQNGKHGGLSSQSHASQHACASLCDEVVVLWRLAALNPGLADQERVVLAQQFRDWHVKVIDKVTKSKGLTVAPLSTASGGNNVAGLGAMQGSPGHVPIGGAGSGHMSRRASQTFRAEVEVFSGFKPAIEATRLDWHEYPIPGITYHPGHRFYHCPFTCFRHVDSTAGGKMEVHASAAVLQNDLPHQQQQPSHHALRPRSVDFSTINGQVAAAAAAAVSNQRDGNRSSVSSEGFCENDENVEAAEADALGSSKLGISRQDSVELEEDWERTAGGKASDDSQNTDKEKSSPEDIDLDSDWSSAPEAAAAAAVRTGGAGNGAALSSGVPTETNGSAGPSQASKPGETGVLAGLKPLDYPLEILLARAEGLHAHGHSAEACRLGVQLANELLASPPDLMVEFPPLMIKGKKKKTNPACHAISCLASATLAKCAFLCTVLSENPEHFHLGFKVGLFGLELARPPATTKALEVKLAYQESELVTLLKRIPLGPAEMAIIRDKAAQLRDGRLRTRGEALLPLSLATFIFEALVMAGLPGNDLDMAFFGVGVPCRSPFYGTLRYPSDEVLGFEAAVAALGLKANVSEAEHPLLCEGTRRQRGDLAIMLLMHYKDDPDKLAKIMDKLLDKEVHQMYKAPLLSTYYTSAGSAHSPANVASSSLRPEDNRSENNTPLTYPPPYGDLRRETNQSSGVQDLENNVAAMSVDPAGAEAPSAVYPNATSTPSRVAGALCTKTTKRRMGLPDRSSPSWDDEDTTWEEPANVAAANCGAIKTGNRVSGIRSLRHAGPGSDSGSSASGKSSGSDSFRTGPSATVGSGNGQPGTALQMGRPSQGPLLPSGMTRHHVMLSGGENVLGPRSGAMNNSKINRYKKRVCPSIPNQPSEASAHFMFELAKTVLNKAGGNSSTSLFTQPSSSSNPRGGPHRALHMCAFQIGLYALGLHNCVSPNWLSRTYSSHVSWITGQAMEIGAQAINFLIGTWEGHLTPPEVASIADRASRGHESSMERAAAELALSCLPHAHALNPNEIQRAIMQCKEQSDEMLERACMAVESAAKGGGVYPEVLFDVSRKWYELYEQHSTPHRHRNSRHHASASSSNSSNSYATYLPSEPYAMDIVHVSQAPPNAAPAQGPPPQTGPPPGIGVTVPYPMASIMPFPLYSFLPGGAPPPGPGCQPSNAAPLSMPMYLSASAGQGPTPYSFAPPLPGLQYFSSLPMPLSNNANTNNAPPPPPSAALLPMSHSQQQPPRGPPLLPTTGPPMSVPVSLPLVHVPIPGALFAQAQPTIPNQPGMRSSPTGGNGTGGSISAAQLRYLLAAYRVGIVALETLGRRAHDDRPQAKYSRNPPYGVDVKWLLSVAKKLGTDYLQQFCISTVNSVVSPFILHEIAVETAHYLTCTAPAGPFVQHLRSRMLTPLVQKCQQMYVQCVHHKMYHIMAAEYDDFVSILQSSRAAFHLTPTGPMQFNDLVQSLQRSKSCSKELWAKIAAALRQPMV